jgi:cytochrome c553
MKHLTRALLLALLMGPVGALAASPALQFDEGGELRPPQDYRQWVFLNSALGLTYGPNRSRPGQAARFSNVFVDPASWRAFQQTGQWPEGTFFVLEIRASQQPPAATDGSQTQASRVAVEAAVRDSSRFPGQGWAYVSFETRAGELQGAKPHARTASCYACHERHGAVQWTFTQFYADAFERAKALGTVRADYDPALKIGDSPH